MRRTVGPYGNVGPLGNLGPLGVVLFVMLAGASQSLRAQDDDISQQLWVDYNPRWVFPSNLELFGDVGVRTELGAQGWGRLVVRPGVRGPVGLFRWSGGVGAFYTKNESFSDRIEIRPFQGIAATWPSRRVLGLDHYLRLEEQFEWGGAAGSSVALRLRYRLQTQYALSGPQENAIWRIRANIEAFATVAGDAGQFKETVRLGLGIGRDFGAAWSAWLDAVWQKSGRAFTGAPTDDLYIRVRVFQSWM